MSHVRVALDLNVDKGDTQAVVDVLFEKRRELAAYAANVIAANDERTEGMRVSPMGGNSHVHDPDDGTCGVCAKYAARPVLAPVEP